MFILVCFVVATLKYWQLPIKSKMNQFLVFKDDISNQTSF
jgi:hypothetical protein